MTKSAVVITTNSDRKKAGEDLGRQILSAFGDKNPDVVVLFASSK